MSDSRKIRVDALASVLLGMSMATVVGMVSGKLGPDASNATIDTIQFITDNIDKMVEVSAEVDAEDALR